MDVSVIIVSWNVLRHLRACLESLRAEAERSPSLLCEVIVVDNASRDGTVDAVRRDFPEVCVVANEDNAGFTRANNQGIRIASGRYVLLLNPDTEIEPGALGAMVQYMDTHERVAVLGPQLVNSDGTHQSSRRRFPRLSTAFVESTVLQEYFPGSRVLRRYYCLDAPQDRVQEVDWLAGACLLVRRRAFEAVGLMDEGFFMYSEELDWCYRMKKADWQVVYLPAARVVHHYAKSSSQDLSHQHIRFQASKCRYFAKHYGWHVGAILRCFLWMTYVYQLAREAAKYFLGHKRTMRRQRIGMLLQVLRSGLRA